MRRRVYLRYLGHDRAELSHLDLLLACKFEPSWSRRIDTVVLDILYANQGHMHGTQKIELYHESMKVNPVAE